MITTDVMGRCHATGLPAQTQPTEIHNGYGPVPDGSDEAVFRPQEPSPVPTIQPQADTGVRGSPSIPGPNAGQQGDSPSRVGGLFAGAGALDLAVHHTLDAQPAWFVENDPAASRVLAHHWPDVPNHGDITAVNWADVEPVDVLCGGFPCTDISSAGKRAGLRPGTRSGLWSHMAYAISQLKPKLVVIENVRGILSADAHCDLEPCPWCLGDNEGRPLRALGCVLGDLAQLGYDARWCGLRASDIGAPHERFRVFISAWPAANSIGREFQRWRIPRIVGSTPRAGESERPERERVRNSARYRGSTVTDPSSAGRGPRSRLRGSARSPVVGNGAPPAADPESIGRGERWAESAGLIRGFDAALSGSAAHSSRSWMTVNGDDYGPAIHRWETLLGRPAPEPMTIGARGGWRLSPLFVEWMQGFPSGWVTDVSGLSRNDQVKICGNGVVPQQATVALRFLLGDVVGRAA